ncbi:MAG: 4'-phosphopantetheinyl transferase superfamily protein [Saprospirales bacterium]|nr:MAG: 4'-phosphopantetheinyl transferase superfamily protein [Saprospirales bacterium]
MFSPCLLVWVKPFVFCIFGSAKVTVMPVCFTKKWMNQTNLVVWKITESEDFFLSKLNGFALVVRELEKIKHASKRLQFLASRYALLEILGAPNFSQLKKTERGKLLLAGNSGLHLSVSHSGHFAAVVVSSFSVGIDIQEYDRRLMFLAPKFVNDREREWINDKDPLLDYHLIWGAKESVFKAWGKGELDFRGHLTIFPVSPNLPNLTDSEYSASLIKEKIKKEYKIWNYKGSYVFLVVAQEVAVEIVV